MALNVTLKNTDLSGVILKPSPNKFRHIETSIEELFKSGTPLDKIEGRLLLIDQGTPMIIMRATDLLQFGTNWASVFEDPDLFDQAVYIPANDDKSADNPILALKLPALVALLWRPSLRSLGLVALLW